MNRINELEKNYKTKYGNYYKFIKDSILRYKEKDINWSDKCYIPTDEVIDILSLGSENLLEIKSILPDARIITSLCGWEANEKNTIKINKIDSDRMFDIPYKDQVININYIYSRIGYGTYIILDMEYLKEYFFESDIDGILLHIEDDKNNQILRLNAQVIFKNRKVDTLYLFIDDGKTITECIDKTLKEYKYNIRNKIKNNKLSTRELIDMLQDIYEDENEYIYLIIYIFFSNVVYFLCETKNNFQLKYKLNGTEKQVDWALNIRDILIEIYDLLLDSINNLDIRENILEISRKTENTLIKILKQEDSKFFINNFKQYNKKTVRTLKMKDIESRIYSIHLLVCNFENIFIEEKLIKMPRIKKEGVELIGTLKQIQWANIIRENLINFLYKAGDVWLTELESGYNLKEDRYIVDINKFLEAMEYLLQENNVKFFIDNFSYNYNNSSNGEIADFISEKFNTLANEGNEIYYGFILALGILKFRSNGL